MAQQELETRAALALLLGRPPEGFNVQAQALTQIDAPSVAPGLPSELLTRRPDVVSVEASLETANANLAAARAELLPSISLTGSGGVSSGTLTSLVTNPFFAAGIGLSLAQTIFDSGRREAVTDEARLREQELLLAYRSATITAFSEVETTLGSIANLEAQEMFQAEQVAQSELAFNIAEARYREGVDDFLIVLDLQRLAVPGARSIRPDQASAIAGAGCTVQSPRRRLGRTGRTSRSSRFISRRAVVRPLALAPAPGCGCW